MNYDKSSVSAVFSDNETKLSCTACKFKTSGPLPTYMFMRVMLRCGIDGGNWSALDYACSYTCKCKFVNTILLKLDWGKTDTEYFQHGIPSLKFQVNLDDVEPTSHTFDFNYRIF